MSVSVFGSAAASGAAPTEPSTPEAGGLTSMMQIRSATVEDHAAIAELTMRVYVEENFVRADSDYISVLRDVSGRAEHTELLVAVDPATGRVVGSVAYASASHDSAYCDVAGDNEAEFRMLVVDQTTRRQGVGEALVRACIGRARATGCTTLRLSTQVTMTGAHRLYGRMGFTRTPDRDWAPEPGITLLTYGLALAPRYCDRCGVDLAEGAQHDCAASGELEPPRWCGYCHRRMVVQVVPTGWTARCVQHGTISG